MNAKNPSEVITPRDDPSRAQHQHKYIPQDSANPPSRPRYTSMMRQGARGVGRLGRSLTAAGVEDVEGGDIKGLGKRMGADAAMTPRLMEVRAIVKATLLHFRSLASSGKVSVPNVSS